MKHTHPALTNPYLRCLLARELLGYRKAYWSSARRGHVIDQQTMNDWRYATDCMITRVGLHFNRHGAAMLQGDPSPLAQYPMAFAGHV